MPAARRTWIDRSVDAYLDELGKLGLNAPRDVVVRQLRTQLSSVAESLGVTAQTARSYFTEDAIRAQARNVAVGLADEQPGSDLSSAPRNIPVPTAMIGRTVAALAEAGRRRLGQDDAAGADNAFGLISMLGNLVSREPANDNDLVLLPQALLNRCARFLDASAEVARSEALVQPIDMGAVSTEALAKAFEDDANDLRLLVSFHGFSSGQVTPG